MKKLLSYVAIALAAVLVVPFAAVGCKKKNPRSALAGVYTFSEINIELPEETVDHVEENEESPEIPSAADIQENIEKEFGTAYITLNVDGTVETNLFDLLLNSEYLVEVLSMMQGEAPFGTFAELLEGADAKLEYNYRWVPFNNYAVFYGEIRIVDQYGDDVDLGDIMGGGGSQTAMFNTMLPFVTNAFQYLEIQGKTFEFSYNYENEEDEEMKATFYLSFKKTKKAKSMKWKAVTSTKAIVGDYTLENVGINIDRDTALESMINSEADKAEEAWNNEDHGGAEFDRAAWISAHREEIAEGFDEEIGFLVNYIPHAFIKLFVEEGRETHFNLKKNHTVETNIGEVLFGLKDIEVEEPEGEPQTDEEKIDYAYTMIVSYAQRFLGYFEEAGIYGASIDYKWASDSNKVAVMFGSVHLYDQDEKEFDFSIDFANPDEEQMTMYGYVLAIPGFFRTASVENTHFILTYQLEMEGIPMTITITFGK